ncbi:MULTISPECIES: MarR family winged helix-turn-helix transcriptional regulator [Aminobacterium]|jgi:DNA-binding MarR family transcriptional regulator|uniref:Transcriptional regulator, MarR family n=1 Tax=Aminobacterium colombiense (strain DSM 12261 / ALA-1) TaxID=572547 RepID=D5EH98_AMICL|nr:MULTISPECIES: MarR family transcriptional regulator [Aminobacterium]MDD2379292.1 MarR family transcriptional regulator [Aminobacterium colombiense]ADE57930.1 transcriptional regulator, MarR family [Aminobacterium colombiense DSM 12261]MDD3768415.1 MarR family transcriptional regulator [Aminobacterium colombiense]MDD4266281.1 MarR family transcriptional regulator [Aminobacterium colombiense]MDD4585178.1 MarR family transcriptional regulator [Aminobacterium colombiense]
MTQQPHIGRWISCLYRQMQCLFDRAFQPLGLGCGNYSFLLMLRRCDGQTQEELSNELGFDKGTTARSLKKLERLGYIQRKRSKIDGRANLVFLTLQGKNVIPFVEQILEDLMSKILEGMSKEEKEMTYSLINKMALNALYLKQVEGDRTP